MLGFEGRNAKRTVFSSRINQVSLTPNGTVRKQAGPVFARGQYYYDPSHLLLREAAFLRELDGRYAPRLIAMEGTWLEMEYGGDELSSNNLPVDWQRQVSEIEVVLADTGIVHRDIKPGNLLVKDGRFNLIDFGWAIKVDENPYVSPRELSSDVPREHIYDNGSALNWLISLYLD